MSLSLQDRNEILEEQIIQLKALLAPPLEFPPDWKLTRAETRVLRTMMAAPDGRRSSEQIHAAVSGDDPETMPKIIHVYVCRLRQKLKPYGVSIVNIFGFGYRLMPESKAVIKVLMGAA